GAARDQRVGGDLGHQVVVQEERLVPHAEVAVAVDEALARLLEREEELRAHGGRRQVQDLERLHRELPAGPDLDLLAIGQVRCLPAGLEVELDPAQAPKGGLARGGRHPADEGAAAGAGGAERCGCRRRAGASAGSFGSRAAARREPTDDGGAGAGVLLPTAGIVVAAGGIVVTGTLGG